MYSFIPIPPRGFLLSRGGPSYEDVNWTAEQVDFTLQMILDKMINGSESDLKIRNESRGSYTIKCGDKVYVSVEKGKVFMILDSKASGAFRTSGWFWKDRPVKASIKKLLYLLDNHAAITEELKRREELEYKREVAMKALFSAFPEAIAKEFEKHVLESKNGESKENKED